MLTTMTIKQIEDYPLPIYTTVKIELLPSKKIYVTVDTHSILFAMRKLGIKEIQVNRYTEGIFLINP